MLSILTLGFEQELGSTPTRIATELPEDIAKRLESAWLDVSRGMLEAVALEGCRDGTLSRGQIWRILGLSFWESEAFTSGLDEH